jgi:hypothetical protein
MQEDATRDARLDVGNEAEEEEEDDDDERRAGPQRWKRRIILTK